MLARGLLLLLFLLLPLAGSAVPFQRAFQGPSFPGSASAPPVARPVQLTLPPTTPAALTFPFVISVSSTPRVLPATAANSGSKAWIDTRGSTGLFTGSIPQSEPIPPVPEPSAAALVALGLVLLAIRRR